MGFGAGMKSTAKASAALVALIFCLSTATSPALGETALPEAPHSETRSSSAFYMDYEVLHYNVCGSACSDTRAQRAMDYAGWFFNANPAYSLSLNEICIQDFLTLAANLGHDGLFVQSKESASGCPGADKRFGNALIVRGLVDAQAVWYLPTQKPSTPCGTQNVECRTMVCIRTFTSVAGEVGQCSTHLENDAAYADDQAAEYAVIGTGWLNPTYPHNFLSGDFNLEEAPLDAAVPFYRDNHWDLVLSYTHSATGTLNKQIDYIWLRMPTIFEGHSAWCPNDASDHCVTSGAGHW